MHIGKNLILVLLGCMMGFIICEIGLRMLNMHGAWFTKLDPLMGWKLNADAKGWHVTEGKALITINSHGMRDYERSLTKDGTVVRIALLGDSFVEALQVPLEETIGARLELELVGCGSFSGKRIEVLNFGVSGYSTIQELIQLKSIVLKFQPDLVIVAFDTVNDVRDNFKMLASQVYRPFLIQEGGEWSLDMRFIDSPFFLSRQQWHWQGYYWLVTHSRLLQIMKRFTLAVMGDKEEAMDYEIGAKEDVNYLSYLPPRDTVWADAWIHTEQALIMMAEELSSRKTPFIITVLGTGIQIHPEVGYRQERAREYGVNDWLYPDRRLIAFGASQGIEVISLTREMQDFAEKSGTPLHFLSDPTRTWGHWNHEGHRVAANILGRFLCKSQGIESGRRVEAVEST